MSKHVKGTRAETGFYIARLSLGVQSKKRPRNKPQLSVEELVMSHVQHFRNLYVMI